MTDIIAPLKEVQPLLYILGVGLLILLAWYRAGSAHFLLERIWWLIAGSRRFNDGELNERWKALRDVEAVRFLTRIRFANLRAANLAFAWIDEHGIALGDLTRVRQYFDTHTTQLRDPKYRTYKYPAACALLALMVTLIPTSYFVNQDKALLSVRTTGTNFWTDGQAAEPLIGDRWQLTAQRCKSESLPLQAEDVQVICEILTNPPLEHLQRISRGQRIFGAVFSMLLIGGIYVVCRKLVTVQLADQLYRKLNPPASCTCGMKSNN
ncbi:hypothetical protein KSS94_16635 [Pseudomonas fakonensis]|uniref:Intracellular growth attenuator protein IgaA n=1 Tax=Pseudomonas fakonensis TaxID=2842355 RepID=A0ABX8N0Q0_9PSED|nr:DUF6216 family protein [Pseudomonas fakonensis]QXH49574.1 hypothetical protein KSS94_16635 [Pseudomonas fakonensis]